MRTGFLFAAIAVPSLFATIIKRLIGRARPFVGAEADPFLYGRWVWRADYASMPSGHATSAFAAAIAVGLLWPRLRSLMLIYALIIAVSRVVLDAHYLSDVIAGAFVGSIGALIVRDWFARRHLGFVVGRRDGRQVVYDLHDDHVAHLLDEAISHVEQLQLGLAGRSSPREVTELTA